MATTIHQHIQIKSITRIRQSRKGRLGVAILTAARDPKESRVCCMFDLCGLCVYIRLQQSFNIVRLMIHN